MSSAIPKGMEVIGGLRILDHGNQDVEISIAQIAKEISKVESQNEKLEIIDDILGPASKSTRNHVIQRVVKYLQDQEQNT